MLNFRVADTLHELIHQGENVFISMIKPKGNFPQIKMEEFSGHSTVGIEPMFRIAPEAFNPVDVGASLGSSCLFPDDDVVASDRQRPVGVPVVGVVEAPGLRVLLDEADHLGAASSLNREDPHLAVPLEDAHDDDLPGSAPAPFALPMPAKHGLVALYGALEGLSAVLLERKRRARQAKEPLDGREGGLEPEAHPVNRDAQDEQFKQPSLGRHRESTGIPHGNPAVPFTTATAFTSTVSEMPRPFTTTCRTASHGQTMLHDLVRFG